MNTPACEEGLEPAGSAGAAPAEPLIEPEPELVELGKISQTQGGLLGAKYDSAVGWQYY
jgi:hypothetical protein